VRALVFAALMIVTSVVLAAESRVTVTIAHLVASKALIMTGPAVLIVAFTATRVFAMPAITPIITIVNVTPESPASVIPRACSDENAARKPLRSVISIRRAIVRRVVKIPIRARGRWPDLDRDLRLHFLN